MLSKIIYKTLGVVFLKSSQPSFPYDILYIHNIWGISNFIMDLENYFKNGKVYIWEETFAIIKLKKPCPEAFAKGEI